MSISISGIEALYTESSPLSSCMNIISYNHAADMHQEAGIGFVAKDFT